MTATLPALLTWFALGMLIGAFHFATLRWNARMFASGRRLALGLALQIVRLAATAAALAAVAIEAGALPLLLAAAGILAARAVAIRWPARS